MSVKRPERFPSQARQRGSGRNSNRVYLPPCHCLARRRIGDTAVTISSQGQSIIFDSGTGDRQANHIFSIFRYFCFSHKWEFYNVSAIIEAVSTVTNLKDKRLSRNWAMFNLRMFSTSIIPWETNSSHLGFTMKHVCAWNTNYTGWN